MTNAVMLDSLHSQMNQSELYHHGILGMHWGVRRFQPYGQGYDPKNEGKEIGLAARMAGHTGSYSSMYGRGRSKSEMAKAALKSFGKKAYGATQELADRANYAADRASRKLSEAGKKARSGLAKYASAEYTQNGHLIRDEHGQKLYEQVSLGDLGKGVASAFMRRTKVNASLAAKTGAEIRSKLSDPELRSSFATNVRSAFSDKVQQTKLNSKQFSTNAQATMALLRGAMDPRSSASQILEGRYNNSAASRYTTGTTKNPIAGLKNPTLRDIGERVTPLGERVNVADTWRSKKPTRDEATSRFGGYGEDLHRQVWDSDSKIRGSVPREIDFARSILLSDMAVKNPYRTAVRATDLDRAKKTVSDIIKTSDDIDKWKRGSSGMNMDPYRYQELKDMTGKRLLGL